jgi:hypothetical protein
MRTIYSPGALMTFEPRKLVQENWTDEQYKVMKRHKKKVNRKVVCTVQNYVVAGGAGGDHSIPNPSPPSFSAIISDV